ncbi:MAG TPA: hypothetical protein VEX16_07500, partial [Methyloceanibacter sp.]|nr:hypothetical protein [Methyloceanibacter sp.]
GFFLDTYEGVAADAYAITNAIFWGNAPSGDLVTACGSGCAAIKMEISHSMVQTEYEDAVSRSSSAQGLSSRLIRSSLRRARATSISSLVAPQSARAIRAATSAPMPTAEVHNGRSRTTQN